MNPAQFAFDLLRDALWSGVAALGFAILFNVPRRTLAACALCGAAGHALRALLMGMGMGIETATLFGSMLIGAMGWIFARHYRTPALIFTVCGAIPMVPGAFAYRAMLGLIEVATADPTIATEALGTAGINLVKTGIILAAIAVGIGTPALLFRHPRPVA